MNPHMNSSGQRKTQCKLKGDRGIKPLQLLKIVIHLDTKKQFDTPHDYFAIETNIIGSYLIEDPPMVMRNNVWQYDRLE
jgi:hypothetical protein